MPQTLTQRGARAAAGMHELTTHMYFLTFQVQLLHQCQANTLKKHTQGRQSSQMCLKMVTLSSVYKKERKLASAVYLNAHEVLHESFATALTSVHNQARSIIFSLLFLCTYFYYFLALTLGLGTVQFYSVFQTIF